VLDGADLSAVRLHEIVKAPRIAGGGYEPISGILYGLRDVPAQPAGAAGH